ncbi:hypothetical protein KR222_004896 [Zaprionus bogoriensis]|nr:hypothetical protein KR222_004896 [Zaprionus bogoriensis]
MLKLLHICRVWNVQRRRHRWSSAMSSSSSTALRNEDNKLDTFRRVCDEIAGESSYLRKAEKLEEFFRKGSSGRGFEGDTLQWVQFLIPGATQRVYNLQNKALIKLFARILHADAQQMHLDLEQGGDISETLRKHFAASSRLKPLTESRLYLDEVEQLLCQLEQRTKEDEQAALLRELCKQATELDLRTFVRLVKQDLRINARARHILDAFGPQAYPAYQSSRDLAAIVRNFAGKPKASASTAERKKTKAASSGIQVMTPISPMLANACKSVEEAFRKHPGGLYSEVKYDGERVQLHKQGAEFRFFSRNLKPVMDHKIRQLKEYIPRAFPGTDDMILDSEIILVDTETGALLPFGTLGAHKKQIYANASVCLFVFDCLLFDGEDLTQLAFSKRREILEQHMQPIKSHVQLSESQFLRTKQELALMTAKVLQANLEGVVLKSPSGTYQPGKRNWLKVKKDYLFGGKMADTADLVVLGAWYGSGKKGGVLSIFLMGCYDARDRLWKTVTKVHSGLDDATNDEIHETLMQLTERADANKLPHWLLCKKALVPDVLAKEPLQMPVWEITGAEFTQSEAHTAAGISIRFPRITRLRSDKSAEQANDLAHLEQLYAASKQHVNVDLLLATGNAGTEQEQTPQKHKVTKRSAKKDSDTEEESPATSSRSAKKAPKLQASAQKNLKDFFKPKAETKSIKLETTAKTESKDYHKPKAEAKGIKLETTAKAVKEELKVESKDFYKPKAEAKGIKLETTTKAVKEELKTESNLFRGLVAHFLDEPTTGAIRAEFERHGGSLTKDPQQAAIVFHDNDKVSVQLQQLRPLYRRSCRHLHLKWIESSLEQETLQPYPPYAVQLSA